MFLGVLVRDLDPSGQGLCMLDVYLLPVSKQNKVGFTTYVSTYVYLEQFW